MDEYVEKNGKSFGEDVVLKIEGPNGLGLPRSAAKYERIVLGHSNAGPAALSVFTACPDLFRKLIMLEPAVCDAPMRYLVDEAYPGSVLSALLTIYSR